ncbi:MAG: tetratricopeptide repeat protein [Terriglobales bacterium]
MKLKDWLFNRVILGMLLFFVLVALWEFRLKPQYRPYYNRAVEHYQRLEYASALDELNRAHDINANAVEVLLLRGWTNLKLHRYTEALEHNFEPVMRNSAKGSDAYKEAELGAAFVALETGKGTMNSEALLAILKERGGDPNVRILVAGALQRDGKNLEAAAIYRELRDDKSYGEASRVALETIFGLKGFNDPMPTSLAALEKPKETRVPFSASAGALWRAGKNGRERFFAAGVTLGPGAPGFFPGTPPDHGSVYTAWLKAAEEMNANLVQVNSLMPPVFYRAYRHHTAAGGKAVLLQQVWLGSAPNKDLFDPGYSEEAQATIRHVVDAMHGRGDVPPSIGLTGGVYEHDLAAQVAAFLLGGDIDPTVVAQTNLTNPGKVSYSGQYISANNATATEVWLAGMMDYLVKYETETYNWQHPVAFANQPALDPIRHLTETSASEAVFVDEGRFKVASGFAAGLFAAYDVYPFQPDFMLQEQQYLSARDSEGPNPVYGYLRDLRSRIPYPLVVTGFGMPDSIGISRIQPSGWNQGGLTEQAQADMVRRMARAIRDTGCAGGIVFELADEWYRRNWLTADFKVPAERATLWLDELDPQNNFGLLGYRPSKWELFAGAGGAWQHEATLYQKPGGPEEATNIRKVQMAADEAFLYVRLEVACLDCPAAGKRPDGKADFDQVAYAVALNTAPTLAGIEAMPFGRMSVAEGANFLLFLGEPSARLLIADQYYPFQEEPLPGYSKYSQLTYRRPMSPKIEPAGHFVDMVVEPNRAREGRGGVIYPAQRYNRSDLRHGNGNPTADDFDSLAEWFADVKGKVILVRIPWGKLLVTDPSSLQAFGGFDAAGSARTFPTPGVDVAVFALKPGAPAADLAAMSVAATWPAASGSKLEGLKRFTWKRWETVKPETYFKKAYYAMQKEYSEQTRAQGGVAGGNRSSAALRGAAGVRSAD